MDYINVEKSTQDFCRHMDISEVDFMVRQINNQQELEDQIVAIFKEHPVIFGKFLFATFELKTGAALIKNGTIVNNLEGMTPHEEIFKKVNLRFIFEDLHSSTGLAFPALVVPTYKHIIELCLFVIPIVSLAIIVFNNIYFFAANFLLLKWIFIVPLIFLPYAAIGLIFPNFFKASNLPREMSYGELISELVNLNRHIYIENNWKNTYAEIPAFLNMISK